MRIKDSFPYNLSDDQNTALENIELFLTAPTNCFLLKGYAGTGKTFLMQGLVKYFKSAGRQFTLMAPTGRAAMVIGDKTKTDAYTIHKNIYNLSELEDDDHTFMFRYKLNLNEDSVNTVYIIDESSMISDVYNEDEFFLFGSGYLLKDLFSFVDFKYRTDAKIIFIGDNAQLPPVGMNFSPALDKEYLTTHYQITTVEFEMKQIQRQQEGSGILSITTQLRNCLETIINYTKRKELGVGGQSRFYKNKNPVSSSHAGERIYRVSHCKHTPLNYICNNSFKGNLMNINDLEKLLSQKRLSTYYNLFPTDKEKAIEYYRLNTQISESLYPLLSNLEIALRNSIHNSFAIHYKSADWFSQFKKPELFDQVNAAKRKILTGHNPMTADKVVAELTFGFWTALFNKQYAKDFWKPLMYAFPLLDTPNKRRDKISYKLNHIRKFRNRIFHYEPICNDLTALATNHNNILEILNWINADIVSWTKQIDRFDNLYKQAVALRTVT